MYKNKEEKILSSLIDKIESDKKSILMRPWFNPLLWLVCAIALLVAFQFFENFNHPLILVITAAFIGIIIGMVSILQVSEKSWPVIKNHINEDSLRQRVNEINT